MSTTTGSSSQLDIYSIVNDRIIFLLEQGSIPWQQPWNEAGIPMNLLSKRPYRGINTWLLASLQFAQNYFLTWDQLKKVGGSVKQGEHGHMVVFWKTVVKNNNATDAAEQNKNQKSHPLLRYYKVFNIAQCNNIPEHLIPALIEPENTPIMDCEALVNHMPDPPSITFAKQGAWYDIVADSINMPRVKSFKTTETYYSTLFHELVHSTGHKKRLDRKTITEMAPFGTQTYSIEELVAELGSCYLCNGAGIINTVIKNNAAYIDGWLTQLRKDKRFIILAASYAQKAVDYILNLQTSESKNEVEQSELITED